MTPFPAVDDHWLATADIASRFLTINGQFYCMWDKEVLIPIVSIPGSELVRIDGFVVGALRSMESISGTAHLKMRGMRGVQKRRFTLSLVTGRPEYPETWRNVFSFLNCSPPMLHLDETGDGFAGYQQFVFHNVEGEIDDALGFIHGAPQ